MPGILIKNPPPKVQELLPVLTRQKRAIARAKTLGQRTAPYLIALWSRKWPVMGGLVAVTTMFVFGPTLVLGPRVVAVAADQGLFLQTVVASGHVEAPHRTC